MTPLTVEQRRELAVFMARPHFAPDAGYTGYKPVGNRASAEAAINRVATDLLVQGRYNSGSFFDVALRELEWFRDSDTEDRERALLAIEQLMDILDIESSEGRLNGWMYG